MNKTIDQYYMDAHKKMTYTGKTCSCGKHHTSIPKDHSLTVEKNEKLKGLWFNCDCKSNLFVRLK